MVAPYRHVGRVRRRSRTRRRSRRTAWPRREWPRSPRPTRRRATTRLEPRPDRRRRRRRPRPPARRAALGGRHELHAGARRREGAAGAPGRDAREARRGLAYLSDFESRPKRPRTTSRSMLTAGRRLEEVPDAVRPAASKPSPPSCAPPSAARPPAAGRAAPRASPARSGVDPRAVLGEERRCLRGRVDVVGRCHLRARRADLRVHDRRRHAALVQDRHRRLADRQRREQLAQVVEVGLREGRDGALQRLRVVRRERAQGVLDAVSELGEHVRRHVLRLSG